MAKIAALLCWYDEPPLWLAATVASLADVVDHLVAVDGAYALFPGGQASSPVEQQAAIVETAAAARLGLTLHVPDERWGGNEVEKRNASLGLALTVATDPSWWLLVIDADERITRHDHLRGRLDLLDEDVAVCDHGLVTNDGRNPVRASRGTDRRRGLFRADPELRYEGSHYTIVGSDGYIAGVAASDLLPSESLLDGDLQFEHLGHLRSAERVKQKETYYSTRNALGIESLTTPWAVHAAKETR